MKHLFSDVSNVISVLRYRQKVRGVDLGMSSRVTKVEEVGI